MVELLIAHGANPAATDEVGRKRKRDADDGGGSKEICRRHPLLSFFLGSSLFLVFLTVL